MRTLIVEVEDRQVELVQQLLRSLPYVGRADALPPPPANEAEPALGSPAAIAKMLANMKTKPFADIEDPVEWQRQIRSEWM